MAAGDEGQQQLFDCRFLPDDPLLDLALDEGELG
jgi:hypothetical protein